MAREPTAQIRQIVARENLGAIVGDGRGKAEELAEAQRLGGARRKRERTVATAFDFTGLASIDAIRRLLEIAATDALGLETSIAKIRALIAVAVAAAKLLETGELAEQLATIEGLLRRQTDAPPAGDFG